ncbi:polyhydroxyalkanoic acid system family protein [Pseudoduganella namucuonensis]|uniref:Putative polyhydroxyalkanoic acid system protein n=1 Tax=Pseudoduganella namucuonensis TaxID=1035707 RepID=A0A1I7LME7_9BURK|nr:polyhydroxyalkanoic acid system family protein [Pseudoduganella namucuonensis]SFV10829.1 putative polyhydroxyalkanoic acid system protein [Pseudoduganella namucuonensis]
MADINIVQEHKLTPKKAREAAEQVAQKLAAEFDLEYEWEGDVLHFERSGVNGSLTLTKHKAEMVIKLGFLFGAFAPVIQAKAAEKMAKIFGATKSA